MVCLIANAVLADICLELSAAIPEANKRRFPKTVDGHHPAGNIKNGLILFYGFRRFFNYPVYFI